MTDRTHLRVRLSPGLHRDALALAAVLNVGVGSLIEEALMTHVRELKQRGGAELEDVLERIPRVRQRLADNLAKLAESD